MPDESFLQTVVMHSPFKQTLLNHNMRWIYWPHQDGDAQEYWDRVGKGGRDFVGGPKVLTAALCQPPAALRTCFPTLCACRIRRCIGWCASYDLYKRSVSLQGVKIE